MVSTMPSAVSGLTNDEASFVGVARVEARKHHWYDVVAGAAIGEASGFLITSKQNQSVHVLPWGDAHSAGAVVDVRF